MNKNKIIALLCLLAISGTAMANEKPLSIFDYYDFSMAVSESGQDSNAAEAARGYLTNKVNQSKDAIVLMEIVDKLHSRIEELSNDRQPTDLLEVDAYITTRYFKMGEFGMPESGDIELSCYSRKLNDFIDKAVLNNNLLCQQNNVLQCGHNAIFAPEFTIKDLDICKNAEARAFAQQFKNKEDVLNYFTSNNSVPEEWYQLKIKIKELYQINKSNEHLENKQAYFSGLKAQIVDHLCTLPIVSGKHAAMCAK